MTGPNLGDPANVARKQVEHLRSNPAQFLHGPLERMLSDSPFVDRDSLLAGLEAFHKERMARVPSTTTYPEAKVWIDHLLAVDRELLAAGLTHQEVALVNSLGDYVRWRGYRQAAKLQDLSTEKCRVVHIAETDRGELHMKNVDDPATFWKPSPQTAVSDERSAFTWRKVGLDGVGSGLHIDDEPDEIFPLNARTMVFNYAEDVPGSVEFFTRYKLFWGGQNIVLYDDKKRSCAIEKTSHNFMEVFESKDGKSHCSGMACRDPESPQGKYQRERRLEYLERFDQPDDGPDMVFWDACDRAERMLSAHLDAAGPQPKFDDLVTLFTTPWPEGLCKTGAKVHPDQTAAGEYTLITHLTLIDEKTGMTWQRDADLNYPDEPFVKTYA